jgi:hypothetical protein
MNKLIIGKSTQEDILRIKLAFDLETENPHLNFFEINKLTNNLLATSRLKLLNKNDENSKNEV